MPRPPTSTPSVSRTYKIPVELAEWLDQEHTVYRMHDGTYANSRIDVVRDALERIKQDQGTYAIAKRDASSVSLHDSRGKAKQLVPVNYRLPETLVEWVQEYYRWHQMLDGTRAADYTDLLVDALERARKKRK